MKCCVGMGVSYRLEKFPSMLVYACMRDEESSFGGSWLGSAVKDLKVHKGICQISVTQWPPQNQKTWVIEAAIKLCIYCKFITCAFEHKTQWRIPAHLWASWEREKETFSQSCKISHTFHLSSWDYGDWTGQYSTVHIHTIILCELRVIFEHITHSLTLFPPPLKLPPCQYERTEFWSQPAHRQRCKRRQTWHGTNALTAWYDHAAFFVFSMADERYYCKCRFEAWTLSLPPSVSYTHLTLPTTPYV